MADKPQRTNYSNALRTEDLQRWMTEQGYNFKTTHKFSSVANDTSANIYIKVGQYVVSVKGRYNLTHTTEVYFYEDPIIDASGSALSTNNYNRNKTNTSTTELYYGPTVDASGNQISYAYIPVATSGLPIGASGGSAEENTIWLLKPNTDYLITMYNRSGGDASNIFIDIRVCEERNYE